MGGHIDLVIPGCGSGLIGFFGDQTGVRLPDDPDLPPGNGGYARPGTLQGGLTGIPGVVNIEGSDWNGWQTYEGQLAGRRPYREDPNLRDSAGRRVNPSSWIAELKVCPKDAEKMCQEAYSMRASPPSFRMAGGNCSSRACQILQAGGVMTGGIGSVDNPQNLMDQLPSVNESWGFTVAVPSPIPYPTGTGIEFITGYSP